LVIVPRLLCSTEQLFKTIPDCCLVGGKEEEQQVKCCFGADGIRIINDLTTRKKIMGAEENKMATRAMAFSAFLALGVDSSTLLTEYIFW
jgi:hypothetical protein